ncbi:hypothetical protein GSI_14971 [Ganoderma sinense ZZ0214-1]|uniref:Uncharacterized protein n=1 Tax=Ganoderma sinense ZZ0214-1 TaxID=1077348 RepID=A0A2G8RQN9_9APHY|nr:hypothetical protein GSI_14971 [Ganoderma sinense ZZ0214-1]
MFPIEKTMRSAAPRLLSLARLLPSHVQHLNTGVNLHGAASGITSAAHGCKFDRSLIRRPLRLA